MVIKRILVLSSIFLGFHLSILAQSGTAIVSNDGQPLPYATVINMRTGRGVFAPANGQVDFTSTFFLAGDTVKITYTGYEDLILRLPPMQPTIVLKYQPVELDEVAVYPCPNSIPTTLKNYTKFVSNYSLGWGNSHGGSWAAFIPNTNNIQGIIETINVELSFLRIPANARKAPCKIRLLQYESTTGLPGTPLIAKEWMVYPTGKKLIFSILDENLRLPKEGMVVAIDNFFAGEQYTYKRKTRITKPDGSYKDTVITNYGFSILAAKGENLLGKGYVSSFSKTGKWHLFNSYPSGKGAGAPMVSLGIKECN